MSSARKHISVVTVGAHYSGKSTLCGHLLFNLNAVKSTEKKPSTPNSYIQCMDTLKEEKLKKQTIQFSKREFFTDSYHYTLIDVPGMQRYIKNMLRGACQSDVALLVISPSCYRTQLLIDGYLRALNLTTFNHNYIVSFPIIQSLLSFYSIDTNKIESYDHVCHHAKLCWLLGCEQIIVCINKMDAILIKYNQQIFEGIKNEMETFLFKMGYKTRKIAFIPVSALKGDNLTEISLNMEWYKGFNVKIKKQRITGHTLLDALEKVIKPPKRYIKKPFRLPVVKIYKVKGVGDVITGRIEQGCIKRGVTVKFYPTGCLGKLFSIQIHYKDVDEASCGDNISVNIKGLPKHNMPQCGDVMVIHDAKCDPDPPLPVSQFNVLIFVQDHPGKLYAAKQEKIYKRVRYSRRSEEIYKGGFTPEVYVRTKMARCQMIEIKWKMGKSTNNQKVECPVYLESGDQAEVVFRPQTAFVVIPFDECKPYGRIVVMNNNQLTMMGKVTRVTKKII